MDLINQVHYFFFQFSNLLLQVHYTGIDHKNIGKLICFPGIETPIVNVRINSIIKI
jgi:hypothetical protein